MDFNEIIKKENISISNICKQYLKESNGLPLLKNLSKNYNDIDRIKVRRRKSKSKIAHIFDETFDNLFFNLHERAIFANGVNSFIPENGKDAFYIFPINNYRYLYSSEVSNSNENYKKALDLFIEEFDENKAIDILTDLLKFTYISNNLVEGIEKGAEIIIYNIPFFLAIRCNIFNSYQDVLKFINS